LLLGLNATTSVAHVFTDEESKLRLCKNADILISATGATAFRWNAYWKAFKLYKKGEGPKPEPCDLTPLVKAEHIKPGAVVVDVGVNRVPAGLEEDGEPVRKEDGKIRFVTQGDVDYEPISEIASHITKPKGGTGPMTNAILIRNVVAQARRAAS